MLGSRLLDKSPKKKGLNESMTEQREKRVRREADRNNRVGHIKNGMRVMQQKIKGMINGRENEENLLDVYIKEEVRKDDINGSTTIGI